MDGISAVIITKNEERNIRRCLESIRQVADEVIVVDDFSTDGTVAICREFNVRVISQQWLGFGPQKNVGNLAAKHEYILSLDADEALDPELAAAILTEKNKGLQGVYTLCRLNYYYGRFIRHGLEFPDIKVRLFHKEQARWADQLVHETLQLPPAVKRVHLNGLLLHYSYYTFEEHILKANKYTTLAARNYFRNGRKASRMKILLSPVFTFFRAYFFKRGFLDGKHGFVLAVMHAHGSFVKYVKLWELHHNKERFNEG